MRKILYIFLFVSVLFSLLALYYVVNKNSPSSLFSTTKTTPTQVPAETKVDLSVCKKSDSGNAEGMYEITGKMREYLLKNEGFTLETKFVGKIIDGTNCFSFKMENYELYVDGENNLYVLKDGQEYKREAPRNWVN